MSGAVNNKKRGRQGEEEEEAAAAAVAAETVTEEEEEADDEKLERNALLEEISHGMMNLGLQREDEDAMIEHRARYSSLTVISRARIGKHLTKREIVDNFVGTEFYKPDEQMHCDVVEHRVHVKFSYRQLLEHCHPTGGPVRCLVLSMGQFLVTKDERKIPFPMTSNGLPLRSLPPHRNARDFDDRRVLVKSSVVRGRVDDVGHEYDEPGTNPFIGSMFLGTSIHERIIDQEKCSKSLFGTGYESYEEELDRRLRYEKEHPASSPPPPPPPQPQVNEDHEMVVDDDDDDYEEEQYPMDVFSLPIDAYHSVQFSDSDDDEETEVERMARSDMAMSIKVSGRTKAHQKERHGNHHYFAYIQAGETFTVDRVITDTREKRGLFSDHRFLSMIGGVYPAQILCGVLLKPSDDGEYISRVERELEEIGHNITADIVKDIPRELTTTMITAVAYLDPLSVYTTSLDQTLMGLGASITSNIVRRLFTKPGTLVELPAPTFVLNRQEYTETLDRALSTIADAVNLYGVGDVAVGETQRVLREEFLSTLDVLLRVREEFLSARESLIKKRDALCTNAYLDERLIMSMFAKINVPNFGPFGRVYTMDADHVKRGRKFVMMTNHLLGACAKKIQDDIIGHIPYQDLVEAEFYIYTQMTLADVMKKFGVDSVAELDVVRELCFTVRTEVCVWPLEAVAGHKPVACDEQAGVFFNDKFFVRTEDGRDVEYSQKEVDARVQFTKDTRSRGVKERLDREEILARKSNGKKRSKKRRRR